ncbi:putative nuclear pore complex protein Nup53 [Monocercomonoides exilis]|uniref:putative nuclear pore complex protein Nup53 n=1 Tax=Monocercomonoides exilis TaxID=2049356 RepID=UPI00355A0D3E|nr:putative nuclear pore complex protein Nup53 [Monocercomonoides exilis]|eukprot:MONOS_5054.1-p1 / transcript=MONOS_5054.1 / gene=MONOS_5054 / organism=Monocercomonoides_exilis_PA203 / gene_product=unspecified product / transcript_product=unspecified product / location=Mono_scaffold00143:27323-28355(+) / protein_length=278 / sequence_SO=supercontig / SO=protein_coding / is_pseudo=false
MNYFGKRRSLLEVSGSPQSTASTSTFTFDSRSKRKAEPKKGTNDSTTLPRIFQNSLYDQYSDRLQVPVDSIPPPKEQITTEKIYLPQFASTPFSSPPFTSSSSSPTFRMLPSPQTNLQEQSLVPTAINNRWILVFGFSPFLLHGIVNYFSQCGKIDAVCPPAEGNWAYIQFNSALSAEQALLKPYVLIQGCMVGVLRVQKMYEWKEDVPTRPYEGVRDSFEAPPSSIEDAMDIEDSESNKKVPNKKDQKLTSEKNDPEKEDLDEKAEPYIFSILKQYF